MGVKVNVLVCPDEPFDKTSDILGVTAIWGFMAMVFLFILALIPPSQIAFANFSTVYYVLFMIVGLLAVVAVPLIIYRLRKPGWKPEETGIHPE